MNWLLAAERSDSASEWSHRHQHPRRHGGCPRGHAGRQLGGNEGSRPWRYIVAPADADSILAVGPLIRCAGTPGSAHAALAPRRSNGTSFSCPVLAGMAAGFWQANPTLTAQQVIGILQRSGQFTAPDDQLGYGIPNFVLAIQPGQPRNAPLRRAACCQQRFHWSCIQTP